MSNRETTPGAYEPKGCLPSVFRGFARWLTVQVEPPPDRTTTPWEYRPAETIDLGSMGTVSVPPRFTRRYEGGEISVTEKGKSWSGDEVDVDPDGSILRSERQIEIENQPNPEEQEMLRRLLRSRN